MQILHREKSKLGKCVSLREWSILMGLWEEFRTQTELRGWLWRKRAHEGDIAPQDSKRKEPRRSWVRLQWTGWGCTGDLGDTELRNWVPEWKIIQCLFFMLAETRGYQLSRTNSFKKFSWEKREQCPWSGAVEHSGAQWLGTDFDRIRFKFRCCHVVAVIQHVTRPL